MSITLSLLLVLLLVAHCVAFRALPSRSGFSKGIFTRKVQKDGARSYMTMQTDFADIFSNRGVVGGVDGMKDHMNSIGFFLKSKTLLLSEGGLSADTLNAIGNSGDLSDAADMAVEGVGLPNIGADVLQRLVGSPLIVAVPITAGILVAVVLGVGISSYSNIKDD